MTTRISGKEIGIVLMIASIFLVGFLYLINNGKMDLFMNRHAYNYEDERPFVGVVLKADDSEHWRLAKQGALAAGEALNIRVKVLAPEKESNVAQQRQLIEDLAEAGTGAICIAPADSAGILDLLRRLSDQDIKVITFDTNAAAMIDVESFVGSDNYKAGVLAANRMSEELDGQGEVLVVSGILNQQTHSDRLKGFKESLQGSEIHIVEVIEADSNDQMAYMKMKAFIDEQGPIDGCFVTNGLMTMGVVEAIVEDDGISLPEIIGVDVQRELLQLIDEGLVDSIISQNPYEMGYEAVSYALKAMNGEKLPIYSKTNTILVTKEGLSAYVQNYE